MIEAFSFYLTDSRVSIKLPFRLRRTLVRPVMLLSKEYILRKPALCVGCSPPPLEGLGEAGFN